MKKKYVQVMTALVAGSAIFASGCGEPTVSSCSDDENFEIIEMIMDDYFAQELGGFYNRGNFSILSYEDVTTHRDLGDSAVCEATISWKNEYDGSYTEEGEDTIEYELKIKDGEEYVEIDPGRM